MFFFFIANLVFCHSPEEVKSKLGTKYLDIRVALSDNLILRIDNFFNSIPTCWGCKSLSEENWNWVPLVHRPVFFLTATGKSICVPLFIDRNTICGWKYDFTSIAVCDKKDSSILSGLSIYPHNDTGLTYKRLLLADTVCFNCYRWTNQYSSPSEVDNNCEKLSRVEGDPSYTFEGISGDTAHVVVVAHNDSGPIRYLDTTLPVRNQYRVFDKNEKIPGLNEGQK